MRSTRKFKAHLGVYLMAFLMQTFLFISAASAAINVNIIQPVENGLSGDDLKVIVTVTSTYEVRSVTAHVEDREVGLIFDEKAYCDKYGTCYPGWVGTIPLAGLARGSHLLTITATDAFNSTGEAQRSFTYDRKPNLSLTDPLDQTVARPQLHITAICTDDDPAGCTSVTAAVRGTDYTVVATGQSGIDETVFLEAWDGQAVTLEIKATDSAGQWSLESRTIYVESSKRLGEVESVSGKIWDVQPDRILFLEKSGDVNALKVRDRASGTDALVMDEPGRVPQYGFLTPRGAIFVEQSGNVLTSIIYDWRDGTLINFGMPNSSVSLEVKGNYAIWNSGQRLILRDLLSGTNTDVADYAGNWMNDVADNGSVVYWGDSYDIYRYIGGVTTQLTNDTTLWNVYPLTDGVNVVYRKQDPCCANQTFAITMYNEEKGEITLAPSRSQGPSPGRDYQANNGWIAFTKSGTGGQLQVWIRSPSGEESQVSFFGTSSYIEALSPDGEVIFRNGDGGRMYPGVPNQPPIDIGSSLGHAFWQDGQWFVTIGRSLFKVSLAAAADLFVAKAAAPDSVTVGDDLAYTVTVTNNGPDEAMGVTLTDTLPADVTFVSATPTQGSCSGTRTITCDLGILANGATATVAIAVTLTTAGQISNTASVAGNESDPDTTNNTAIVVTTVNFRQFTLMVAKAGSGSGTVTSNPPGIDCGTDCLESYTSGTSVTLTATPGNGSTFVGWRDACSGTGPCTLIMDSAKTATAILITPLTIGASALGGEVGMDYYGSLEISGGLPPYTVGVVKGALPPGLSSNSEGITGTPTKAGISSFTVQVTDDLDSSVSKKVRMRVFNALNIPTRNLRKGKVGKKYNAVLKATGGKKPYIWSLFAGSLPEGLSLKSSTGKITGTPTAPGSSNPAFQVTDALGNTVSKSLSLDIN